MRRPGPVVVLATVVLAAACTAGAPWPDGLESVAHPDLAGVEASARRQLAAQREALEELLGRGRGEVSELAGAFGQMGRLYHAYRLYEPGAACYQNARRLDPQGFRWPYYLGLLEQASGRFSEARQHFERALEIGPENAPARLRLGTVLLAMNDPPAARGWLEPLAGDARFAAAAHEGLGRAAASSGDAAQAVLHFEKVLELAPESGSVHHALATALRRLGRDEEARRHFAAKGAGEVSFPDPLAERLDELAVSSGSYLRRGNRALMEGRLDEAVTAYRKAVDTASSGTAGVEARRNLALALLRQGEAGEAVRQLETAITAAPGDARLHFDLGNAQQALGATAAAISAYQRAVELTPDFVAARFNLANALAQQDRWEEAGGLLDEVLELRPGHSRARYLAAMALHRRGRSEDAAERLAALIDDEPGHLAARRGLATVHAELKRPLRALGVYREALDLDLEVSDKAELLRQAAQLAWRSGRRREAVGYFRAGVELEPDSSAAYTQLANALQVAGDHPEAAELFARAVELDPDNATAWLSEASLLILAGDYERAVARLGEALQRKPGHVGLVHTLARLLATCPVAALRDGGRAFRLAQRAYESERSLEHAATVAMALAELGRFEEAVRWQRSLAQQAAGNAPAAVRQRLLAHLKLFESRKPVRIGGDVKR